MRQGVSGKNSRLDTPGGAKYPLMSIIRSVGFPASTVTPPRLPAGTMAAFAITLPSVEFSVETPGYPLPAGHTDKKPSGPSGTTVKFKEYAFAVAGMEQPPERSGKLRDVLAARLGGPNGPVKGWLLRVSAMRHGASG